MEPKVSQAWSNRTPAEREALRRDIINFKRTRRQHTLDRILSGVGAGFEGLRGTSPAVIAQQYGARMGFSKSQVSALEGQLVSIAEKLGALEGEQRKPLLRR